MPHSIRTGPLTKAIFCQLLFVKLTASQPAFQPLQGACRLLLAGWTAAAVAASRLRVTSIAGTSCCCCCCYPRERLSTCWWANTCTIWRDPTKEGSAVQEGVGTQGHRKPSQGRSTAHPCFVPFSKTIKALCRTLPTCDCMNLSCD